MIKQKENNGDGIYHFMLNVDTQKSMKCRQGSGSGLDGIS
jgi:hypothetical protein